MSRVVRLHEDTLDRLLALRQGEESVQDVLERIVPAPVDRYTGLRNAVRAHLAMLEQFGLTLHLPHGAFDRLKNALEAAPAFTDPHAPCCRFHATGGAQTASCGGDDARLPGWDTATVVCAHCDGAGCAECHETGEVVVPEPQTVPRGSRALVLLALLVGTLVSACNPRTPDPFGTVISCDLVARGAVPYGTPCVGLYPPDTLACGKRSGSC